MKLKKLLGLTFAALAFFCVASRSEAASYARSPKEIKNIGYSTAITSVTVNTITTSTSSIPGAVYDVYLGTGTAGDFCVLYDTNIATNLTVPVAGTMSNLTNQLGPRLFFGSTTAETTIAFDPPIRFFAGLYTACTSANDSAAIEFETGSGLSGN